VIKRLVLVDRTRNRICGDTSAPGPHARTWASIVAQLDDDTAGLATCAARLLDKSLGKEPCDYLFAPFVADQDSDGYLIFDCSGCEDTPASIMSDQVDPNEAIYAIMTSCFYVGYVRRDH
jgi:hypothetical protein